MGYITIYTGGEGNCLPKALSHLFFGNEDHHFEVRCRIVEAGVLNEDDFVMHKMLTRGVRNGSRNRSQQYVTYSSQLQARHRRLDRDEILDVYQREIMVITRNFEYMGIWQIHGGSWGSVFPYPANLSLWADLNRIIKPLNLNFNNRKPLHVQWIPLNKKHHASNIKHFICLMKASDYS